MRIASRSVLAMLAAVLATSALAAASASAAPTWVVGGVHQKGGGAETFTSKGGPYTLAVGFAQDIQCTTEKDSGELTFTEPGKGKLKITFEGCTTPGLANCEVSDTGSGKTVGTIRTIELKTELKSFKGVTYEHFQSPSESTPITTVEVKNKEGKVCNAKGKFPVEGDDCAEVGPEAISLRFKTSDAIATACGAKLQTEGSVDSMTGSDERIMTGAKKGLTFGAA
jgi:hypothetical protein